MAACSRDDTAIAKQASIHPVPMLASLTTAEIIVTQRCTERTAFLATPLEDDPGSAMLDGSRHLSFLAVLCEPASRSSDASDVHLAGWRGSLADMREAIGPPGGGSGGSPSTYMDAAKVASRQLQTLAPLIAAIGQAQLLQQRTNFELRSTSRCVARLRPVEGQGLPGG